MRRFCLILAAAMLASAAPALAGPPEDFKALTDEYWAFTMREFPTFASQLGKEIMPDFLHLSAKGYQIWADAIKEPLAALLK